MYFAALRGVFWDQPLLQPGESAEFPKLTKKRKRYPVLENAAMMQLLVNKCCSTRRSIRTELLLLHPSLGEDGLSLEYETKRMQNLVRYHKKGTAGVKHSDLQERSVASLIKKTKNDTKSARRRSIPQQLKGSGRKVKCPDWEYELFNFWVDLVGGHAERKPA